jgi:hypothetical protein
MKRLVFLGALASLGFVPTTAFAEDPFRIEYAQNPGFVYELAAGSAPGMAIVRIRNGSLTVQTVYRAFPTAENTFEVWDDDHHRVRPRPSAPAAYGRVTSRGSQLAPGETTEAQVDLNELFVLTPGRRYRVKARTDLRFGPSDRAVVTKLRSNEVTISG